MKEHVAEVIKKLSTKCCVHCFKFYFEKIVHSCETNHVSRAHTTLTYSCVVYVGALLFVCFETARLPRAVSRKVKVSVEKGGRLLHQSPPSLCFEDTSNAPTYRTRGLFGHCKNVDGREKLQQMR